MSRRVLMSPESQSFLRHIADNPEDDVARKVYADCLEENGMPHFSKYIYNATKVGIEAIRSNNHKTVSPIQRSIKNPELTRIYVSLLGNKTKKELKIDSTHPMDPYQIGREGFPIMPFSQDEADDNNLGLAEHNAKEQEHGQA